MTSSAFLNPLLQSALGSSLHGDEPNAQLLSFAVCDPPALIHPHGNHPSHPSHISPHTTYTAVDALDFLQLRYKVNTLILLLTSDLLQVEWPCNIVITESTLKKYNEVRPSTHRSVVLLICRAGCQVFHLLLQLRRASWTLKNVFTQLQRCE